METCIALLRGINVAGQKQIRMAELRELAENLGFGRVRTYIQSGNVLFESGGMSEEEAAGRLEAAIREGFGYTVKVIARFASRLEAVIAANPFREEAEAEDMSLYASFLAREPSPDAAALLETYATEAERYRILGDTVYVLVNKGTYGRSQFSNNFLEKKLQVEATTRNWQTVNKLAALASE